MVGSSSYNLPLINFKLTEGMPCMDKQEKGLSPNRRNNPLLKGQKGCYTTIGSSIRYDIRYTFVDKILEADLYKDNNLLEDLEPMLSFTEFNEDFVLYFRSYIDWYPE